MYQQADRSSQNKVDSRKDESSSEKKALDPKQAREIFRKTEIPSKNLGTAQKKEGAEAQGELAQTGKGTQTDLPGQVQAKLEQSFDTSLDSINIYKDAPSAKDMGALAYTQGENIHFAPGQFSPETHKGQELLGHEVTHTIQQREGRVKPDSASMKMPKREKSEKQKARELKYQETHGTTGIKILSVKCKFN